MALYTGIGGAKREIISLYTGVGGVRKEITSLYTGIGGVKKQIFAAKRVWQRYNIINTPHYNTVFQYSYSSLSTSSDIDISNGYNGSGYTIGAEGFTLTGAVTMNGNLLVPSYAVSDTLCIPDGHSGAHFKPSTGQYLYHLTERLPSSDWLRFVAESYSINTTYTQSRGAYVDTIIAPKDTYPANGVSGGYWYVLI